MSTEVSRCIAWCHLVQAQVTWRDNQDVLVRARVRGTVRAVARPTFVAAVQALRDPEMHGWQPPDVTDPVANAYEESTSAAGHYDGGKL